MPALLTRRGLLCLHLHNRNPRRNKQIRPPIVDRENSDGTESDEFCAPKEEQKTVKRVRKQKTVKRAKKQVLKRNPTSQMDGVESFLYFAHFLNPTMKFDCTPERSFGVYNIPSPVLMSEDDD